MAFLDENYLLENESAKKLYEQVKDLPILDAHNHGDVEEIVVNKGWSDIWEVEAATDHYVWEMMRKRGVPEEKITGKASNKEKWLALAKVFPEIAGNPTYEWIHLDLKRRFGIDELISEHTAELIWEKTKSALATDAMKPVSLLKAMNVKVMCTTDEPFSLLEDHQKAKSEIEGVSILPTWRPDKAMNIEKDSWKDFVDKMGERFDEDTSDLNSFLSAMQKSHDFFVENACRASDHGILEPYSYFVEDAIAASIHEKAYNGEELSEKEVKDYKAYILVKFGEMNAKSNWVTQLHIGAVRDYNDTLFEALGPDTGGDLSTNNIEIVENLKYLLNKLEGSKVVLYCLDPNHWPTLATISRAFAHVSLGAAWWFNDSPHGMEEQLKYISTVDLLANFAGMVSDSRKLISYGSRMEMFRRSMCNAIGKMVERGQIPFHVASDLASGLSYNQAKELFFS
ncbi:glucuronate isomerase [Natronospora cellulosivora (SeqCode)]